MLAEVTRGRARLDGRAARDGGLWYHFEPTIGDLGRLCEKVPDDVWGSVKAEPVDLDN